MAIAKPDLTRVWAKSAPSGNVVDPDTTTPGKFSAGWTAEVPPFEHFNFLQKFFTEGLAHINEQGIALWDATTIYPVNALSKRNGIVYRALVEQAGNDPDLDDGTNWVIAFKDHEYPTLAILLDKITINDVGKVISTIEHSSGYGYRGANDYLVRPYSAGTYDTGSLVRGTTDTSVEVVGLFKGGHYLEQFGAHQSNTAIDSTAAFQALIAYTNRQFWGNGPYKLDAAILLANKGVINSAITPQDACSVYCQSTKIVAGSTVGVAGAEDLISLGSYTSIEGSLNIDCNFNANLSGFVLGYDNGSLREASWENKVGHISVVNSSKVGVGLISSGDSGVYRNSVGSIYCVYCDIGFLARTETGITKVNDNTVGILTTLWCNYGAYFDVISSFSTGLLNSEASNTMNLTILDSYSVNVNGGHMENVEDNGHITNISDDGSITVLTITHVVDVNVTAGPYSNREFNNGDQIYITGSPHAALNDKVWTVEQRAGTNPGYTIKLTGGPTGLTGSSGEAWLYPGRNLKIDAGANTNGIVISQTISPSFNLDLPAVSTARRIALNLQSGRKYLGTDQVEFMTVAPRHPITGIPTGGNDLDSALNHFEIVNSMRCFRRSQAVNFFKIIMASVNGVGNPMGLRIYNEDEATLLAEFTYYGRLKLLEGLEVYNGGASITSSTGAPVGSPPGTRGIYIRQDGGVGTTLYYWDGSAWNAVA